MIKLRENGVFWRESADEVIALDADGSRYYSATASAVTLWKRLSTGATEAELVAALRERYDVGAGDAASAVRDFVAQLDERGLLEHSD